MGTPTRIRGADAHGLLYACELARRGVEVVVTDPRDGPDPGPLVLGPRGQEHAHHLGLDLDGHRLHGLTVVSDGGRAAHLSMDELVTPVPFLLALPEGEVRLLEFARSLGVEVRWQEGAEAEPVGRVGWSVVARVGGVPEDELLLAVDDEALLAVVPLGEGRALLRIEGVGPRPVPGDWTRWLNERGPAGAWLADPSAPQPVALDASIWTDTDAARGRGWVEALVLTGRARPELAEAPRSEWAREARRRSSRRRFVSRVVTFRQPVPSGRVARLAPHLARWHPVIERIGRIRADLAPGHRKSAWVGEDRDPLLLARVGRDRQAETPTLAAYLDFSGGPVPGDRAPDAPFGPGGGRRLRNALRGHRHGLLLFDGMADTEDGYRLLARIAREVEDRYGDVVAACVVVPSDDRPAALDWDGPVLADPDFTLHTAFGARSECLYLVRPDGFVGYRSQPAGLEGLLGHLARLFVQQDTVQS